MNSEGLADESLRTGLTRLLLEGADISDPGTTEEFLQLAAGAATLHTEANKLLHSAVSSARSAGATWQAIGETLGMTKQAAQKRFARAATSGETHLDPHERIIGPTTFFNELRELDLAGQYGWHSVEVGPNHHRVIASETRWEHCRITMSPARVSRQQAEGWEVVGSSFPYTYLKRDTQKPRLVEQRPLQPIWEIGT